MKLIKPKKSLGQNFLIDKNVIDLIIDAGNIEKMMWFLKLDQEQVILHKKSCLKNQKKFLQ